MHKGLNINITSPLSKTFATIAWSSLIKGSGMRFFSLFGSSAY